MLIWIILLELTIWFGIWSDQTHPKFKSDSFIIGFILSLIFLILETSVIIIVITEKVLKSVFPLLTPILNKSTIMEAKSHFENMPYYVTKPNPVKHHFMPHSLIDDKSANYHSNSLLKTFLKYRFGRHFHYMMTAEEVSNWNQLWDYNNHARNVLFLEGGFKARLQKINTEGVNRTLLDNKIKELCEFILEYKYCFSEFKAKNMKKYETKENLKQEGYFYNDLV